MIVLGAGTVGCEMAQAFARLGTRVTLVEMRSRVLVAEEQDASSIVAGALTADGVDIRVGSKVELVERRSNGGVGVRLDCGASIGVAELLGAVGRSPSGRGVGLEEIGVEVDDRGAVVVDTAMATTVPGIWAAGDVTGGLQLTRGGADGLGGGVERTVQVHEDPHVPFRPDQRAVGDVYEP